MDKVILVMNDPMFCCNCPLARMRFNRGGYVCAIARQTDKDCYWEKVDMDSETKPDWCPLQPAPKEQEIWFDDERNDWERGYNNCLREIVGK